MSSFDGWWLSTVSNESVGNLLLRIIAEAAYNAGVEHEWLRPKTMRLRSQGGSPQKASTTGDQEG